jgi:pseudouridine synthase
VSEKEFVITLREGRNRQIRRMVQMVGNEVTSLHRLRVGPVWLGELPEGRWRYLDQGENEALLNSVSRMRKQRS